MKGKAGHHACGRGPRTENRARQEYKVNRFQGVYRHAGRTKEVRGIHEKGHQLKYY